MIVKQDLAPPLDEGLALAMVRAQDELNSKRDPQWVDAGWPLLRAAAVEAARGLDRLDWKWWKREEGGCHAVGDSLAGVWRHGLSHLIVERRGDLAAVAKYLSWSSRHGAAPIRLDHGVHDPRGLDLAGLLDLLVGLCAVGRFPLAVLGQLMATCKVEWPALARTHLSDCVLQSFRLARGVNERTPVQFGDGREDREHLFEIAAALNGEHATWGERLSAGLLERYAREEKARA